MELTEIYVATLLPVRVTMDEERVYRIDFASGASREKKTSLAKLVDEELRAYFAGKLKAFSFPIQQNQGTTFQRQIWRALADIPFGQSLSYAELATAAGHAKSYRAVGGACHRNPLPLVIPCHRVLAKNGLGGFAPGAQHKKVLLKLEGIPYEL